MKALTRIVPVGGLTVVAAIVALRFASDYSVRTVVAEELGVSVRTVKLKKIDLIPALDDYCAFFRVADADGILRKRIVANPQIHTRGSREPLTVFIPLVEGESRMADDVSWWNVPHRPSARNGAKEYVTIWRGRFRTNLIIYEDAIYGFMKTQR